MDQQNKQLFHNHSLLSSNFITSSFTLSHLLSIALILCCATAILINKRRRRRRRRSLRLPPGPSPLPLLGNLHQIYGSTVQDLQGSLNQLSKKYGPIVQLHLGAVPAVVVSSASLAMEILKTQDLKFATHPSTAWGKRISYDHSDIAFCPYNSRWRYVRKVLTLELLTAKRMEQYQDLRVQEVRRMLQSIQKAGEGGEGEGEKGEVDLESKLNGLGFDIISRLLLNERCTGSTRIDHVSKIRSLVLEMTTLFDAFVVEDYFPWLSLFMDPNKRKIQSIHRKIDEVLEQILLQHEAAYSSPPSPTGNSPDFVDSLLHLQKSRTQESEYFSKDAIKAIVLDLFLAASEPPPLFVRLAMSHLLQNAELLKQAQAELDEVVGHSCMVEESHIPRLHFLKAVVRETLRHYPELLFRECMEDCEVGGYDIPRGTRVFLNSWFISHDPSFWERPFDFYPQRFLEESSHTEERGESFHLLPFGSGRRRCPAISLGLTMTRLILASLLHCFDWHLPQRSMPNMADGMMPLLVIPKPRSSTKLYMEA